jgi:Zn finger protein HypA/HybF involved in hydrogenase expression
MALNELQKAADKIAAYRKAITVGDMTFAPSDGRCWSCAADLIELHHQGKEVATGCPKCHRSFVE